MTECPKPGIYEGVKFDDYVLWDAVSNSSLQPARRSMAHYRARPIVEETPAMRLGTLVHSGKFEPLTIAQRYVVMPKFEEQVRKPNGDHYEKPKLSAAYKEMADEFRKMNANKIIVGEDEYERMVRICDSLARSERANEYLAHASNKYEVTLVWDDPETGLRCKGRVDALSQLRQRASDLKTTGELSEFSKNIFYRGYHRQGAFYVDGLEVLTDELFDFTLTAVETDRPYCVCAAPLSDDALDVGRSEYRGLLRQIAEAKFRDYWPGIESPDEWNLPAWAVPNDENVQLVIGGKKFSFN